jgi:dipeptidyl aminopeptidase/acylaminoacyl peptidase
MPLQPQSLLSEIHHGGTEFTEVAQRLKPEGFCEMTLTATLRLAATIVIVFMYLAATSAQPRRPMPFRSPSDILNVANVSDAQISPNGQWVVYTVATVDSDRNISTLYLARANVELASNPNIIQQRPTTRAPADSTSWPEAQSTTKPLLPSDWNASTPRWSPDSNQIAFLGTHGNRSCIWAFSIGRPTPAAPAQCVAVIEDTNFFITYAGEPFAWSPDSKRIAYISATEETVDSRVSSDSPDPRVIDRLQYKSRTSFSDNRRTHVWLTTVDRPEPRQLTSGNFYDHALSFSPRGNEIVFLSNHEADPDANNNSDIFAVDLNGQVRQITETRGCEYEPVWSPDGESIAFTATRRDVTTIDSVAEDTHVWVMDASGNNRRELTAEQDRRARNPRWLDSRNLLFLANDRGQTLLFRVGADGGRVRPALESPYFAVPGAPESYPKQSLDPFQVSGYSIRQGTIPVIALTLSDSTHPVEVWLAGVPISSTARAPFARLTSHNSGFYRLVRPEELKVKSFDGTPIQGWLIKPVGMREDRKYPLILSIHGGPHGMYGWSFNPTFQLYAAKGYAVLYLNPRGSSGYGQRFSDGTLNEWGGGDYRELMAGVDEVLRKYSWIDGDRMGVTGGSYGGFMTNWMITQTTRFKAAVAVASLSNLISFYSTSLYQDLIHAEFGGFPWDNYEALWQWSPLRYVKQVQTPTMFIHGEQDNDVHITQAEEMYMALRRRGVETVLVRYPREGHGLREPKHRVDALERTLAWFDRFLK